MPPTICKKAEQMESATASIKISARPKQATAKPLARRMLARDNSKAQALQLRRHRRLAHSPGRNRSLVRSRNQVPSRGRGKDRDPADRKSVV